MAEFKHTIDLRPIIQKFRSGEITVRDAGKQVAAKLNEVVPEDDQDMTFEIAVNELEDFVETEEEFNERMDSIYDWADTDQGPGKDWPRKKMAWIQLDPEYSL